jgi:predicted TIM-barrel fold metal-dependent hydrolase
MTLEAIPTVDVWAQHPTAEFLDREMFDSVMRWQGTDASVDVPFDWTVQAFESAGVDTALLSAWWGPEGPLLSNEFVAELVSRQPDRFLGVGSVPLDSPMKAVETVRTCVEDHGFVGIRNIPWLWELPPDDRRYYPVYAECVEQDVPFCLQVGHTGPLKPSEMGRPIPYLDNVAREFPDLTIIAGHIGHPWTEETMALATKYENVYIDTSAYKPKRFPEEFVEFMRTYGRENVIFGTNYPMIQPGTYLDGLESLDLDRETAELFLYKNAERAFGVDLV